MTDAEKIVETSMGFFRGKALCAAVRLGVADALEDGEMSLEELARVVEANPDALYRLLRALASVGFFQETAPGRFVLTPLGQPLRRNAPDSVWASVIFWADLLADSWTYLAESVRAGGKFGTDAERARQGVKSRWSLEPDARSIFHAVFAEPSPESMAPIVDAYDFSTSRVVADLGGAGGGLIAAILMTYPNVRGMLVDREEAVAKAKLRMVEAELSKRCELIVGDVLEAVPAGSDLYIMKNVLHGYDNDNALRILQNCRSVLNAEGRLLVVEAVLPTRVAEADTGLEGVFMADLNMMVVTGGRERSESEWTSLLSSAGLALRRIISVHGAAVCIIEAARAG